MENKIMNGIRKMPKNFRFYLGVAITGLMIAANLGSASAAALTNASITLADSRPSVSTSYTFQAAAFSATAIQCIQFQFAVNSDMSGGVPTGLTSTTATLASSTLITPSSWTVAAATNGTVNLTNTTGQAPLAATGNIVLGTITNGSVAGTPYFVKISTYTASACTGAVDNVTVGIIYTAGQAVSVTVNPILSFSVAGLASGVVVNGATTTFQTFAGTIPFGSTPTLAANAIGGQALTVSTNSGNGYTVAASYTGPLSNGVHSITNFSGTNAAPIAFTGAGTENFGYTTTGETRFSSDLWAGLTTSAAIVASSTAPVNNATSDTAFQVGLSTATPPGSYASTVKSFPIRK